jgi:hypothetical protein
MLARSSECLELVYLSGSTAGALSSSWDRRIHLTRGDNGNAGRPRIAMSSRAKSRDLTNEVDVTQVGDVLRSAQDDTAVLVTRSYHP